MIEICMACRAGMHEECDPTENVDVLDNCCCPEETTMPIGFGPAVTAKDSRTDTDLKDPISTGRKEAARLWPIIDGMTCEWAHLAQAGGGVFPIVGCNGSVLYTEGDLGNIHHGPDKNTLNNTRENIHRICPTCHNRWHALNDPFYGERPDYSMPFIPLVEPDKMLEHNTELIATPLQKEINNKYWELPTREKKAINYRELIDSNG